jgi:phosphoglycerate dehydrogenase-like enzyme
MKAIIYPFSPTEPTVQLTKDFPELDWTVAASPDEVARAVPGATIYVASNRTCTAATGEALRRHGGALRWMHFTSSGFERGLAMGLPEGVVVTNATGVKAGMVSEHALLMLLALARRMPDIAAAQRRHEWLRAEISGTMRTLENATVCIVGRGAIGRELARKLTGIDARPIMVSRDPERDGEGGTVFPRARMLEALAVADAVAVCTSGDDSSHHLIGAAELAAMKPGAVIVNVARGSIVDEAALISALRNGRIAGAALDVAETEPMAPGNPLWNMPNVIISPHVAGQGSTGYPQQKRLFGENLARLRAGKPLLNECRIPVQSS